MAERLTVCNKCNSRGFETLKEINPDTLDMNMKVEMKCKHCGHVDNYLVISHYMRRQRASGRAR